MRRGEDDDGAALRRQPVEHVEPVEPRHLDVEQEEVHVLVPEQVERLDPVRRLADEADAPGVDERLEEAGEPAAGRRFVVNEQGAKHRGRQ